MHLRVPVVTKIAPTMNLDGAIALFSDIRDVLDRLGVKRAALPQAIRSHLPYGMRI